MAISLNDNLNINAPKPIDRKYSNNGIPFTSVAEANTAIAAGVRSIGLTVNINYAEYWYKQGTSDSDLVLKFADAGTSGNGLQFESGLTATEGVVRFGGELLQDTTVNGDFSLTLQPSTFAVNTSSGIAMSSNDGITIQNNGGVGGLTIENNTLDGEAAGMTINTYNGLDINLQGSTGNFDVNVRGANFIIGNNDTELNLQGGGGSIDVGVNGFEVHLSSGGPVVELGGDSWMIGYPDNVYINSLDGLMTIYANSTGLEVTANDFDLTSSNEIEMHSNDATFHMMSGGRVEITNNTYGVALDYFGGLVYVDDYSADFQDRSLVDKAYVDNTINALSGTNGNDYTFNDGLTETDGVVRLGGTLNSNVSIDLNSLNFGLGSNTLTNASLTLGFGSSNNFSNAYRSVAFGNSNNLTSSSTSFAFGGSNNLSNGYYSMAFGSNNTASNSNAIAMGANAIASGYNSLAIGYNTQATQSYTQSFGYNSQATQSYAQAQGYYTLASGYYSQARGQYAQATGENAVALGGGWGETKAVLASGSSSFNLSANNNSQTNGHGALADYSAIFGGLNHNIPSTSQRSVIIGGNAIKARASDPDQVYVSNFNIVNTPALAGTIGYSYLVRESGTGKVKSILSSTIESNTRYSTTIDGDNTTTDFVVTHGLGSRAVIVQVMNNDSPYNTIETSVERTTIDTVTIGFSPAPTSSDSYLVLILK
jgi:hypothetical protein